MPLVGKIGPGRLWALLEEILPQIQENRVELHSVQEVATLQVKHGQIQELVHQHHKIHPVLDHVNAWKDGLFYVYDPEEKHTAHPHLPPIFLLFSSQDQTTSLRQALRTLNYPVWAICYPHEFMELWEAYHPALLMVTADAVSLIPQALFAKPHEQSLSQRIKVLCLGTPPKPWMVPNSVSLQSLPWPCTEEQLHKTIHSLLPAVPSMPSPAPLASPYPRSGESSLQTSDSFVRLLSAITPGLPKDLGFYVHPLQRKTLEHLQVAPEWTRWLLSLDYSLPFSHYLAQSPGTPEQTDVLVRYLLHLGILTTHHALYSLLAPTTEVPFTSPPELGLKIIKVVTLGLRGQWKEDWIFSLQQISQQMSIRVPRNPSVHIPYLPKTELARIPLPNNTLLLFYGMLHEEKVDTFLEKMGGHLDALLFFVETSREAEILHAQQARQRLLQQYQVPSVVMLTQLGIAPNTTEVERLRLSPQEHIVPLGKLDEATTHQVLYQLLQQFPQHRNIMLPPP